MRERVINNFAIYLNAEIYIESTSFAYLPASLLFAEQRAPLVNQNLRSNLPITLGAYMLLAMRRPDADIQIQSLDSTSPCRFVCVPFSSV